MKWDPVFYHRFDDPVWNIHIRHNGGLLIEMRDQADERIRFCSTDHTFQHITDIISDHIPWFSLPVYADDRLLLIKRFDDRINPDRTDLLCYDQETGEMVWSKTGTAFISRTHEGFKCASSAEDAEVVLDMFSGNVLRAENPEPIETEYPLEFPVHYQEGSEYFEEVAAYIRGISAEEPVRAIDYAERTGHILISFYTRGGSDLALHLHVVDEKGGICLQETLGSDFRGIADPPFLFYGGNLIFVKEKRHFFVYAIPKED